MGGNIQKRTWRFACMSNAEYMLLFGYISFLDCDKIMRNSSRRRITFTYFEPCGHGVDYKKIVALQEMGYRQKGIARVSCYVRTPSNFRFREHIPSRACVDAQNSKLQ